MVLLKLYQLHIVHVMLFVCMYCRGMSRAFAVLSRFGLSELLLFNRENMRENIRRGLEWYILPLNFSIFWNICRFFFGELVTEIPFLFKHSRNSSQDTYFYILPQFRNLQVSAGITYLRPFLLQTNAIGPENSLPRILNINTFIQTYSKKVEFRIQCHFGH